MTTYNKKSATKLIDTANRTIVIVKDLLKGRKQHEIVSDYGFPKQLVNYYHKLLKVKDY